MCEGGGVYERNRCNLSNWRLAKKPCNFGGSKIAILKHLAL